MPNCLLDAVGLPLMRREELDAAAAVVLVGVVGSTYSGPLLLVVLDEPPPVAGDIAVGFPSMKREPAPVDAVLEYVRLAFCWIAMMIEEDEDDTEEPSLVLVR